MNNSYRGLRRHPLALAFGFSCLLAGGTAAADSDLRVSYSGLNCDPSLRDAVHYKRPSGYEAIDDTAILCPIDRDATGLDALPRVVVEGYNRQVDPPNSEYNCTVYWVEEDGDDPIRGTSFTQTASRAGYFQFIFDADNYRDGSSLTPGGEGTMGLVCQNLHSIDQLTQYQVEENRY